jgi:hypothetical protein
MRRRIRSGRRRRQPQRRPGQVRTASPLIFVHRHHQSPLCSLLLYFVRLAAGLDEEEEEEDKKDEEEGGHGASLSQFAVNPLGGTGNYAVNSPRSKSAAKRARKKAGGKTGGPTNIDDMSDEQVLNLLLGSDTKRAEAAKAKLLEKKEKEEKEKAAKKAAAKKAFEAKEKAEEAARQAEFKKINAKYAMRL